MYSHTCIPLVVEVAARKFKMNVCFERAQEKIKFLTTAGDQTGVPGPNRCDRFCSCPARALTGTSSAETPARATSSADTWSQKWLFITAAPVIKLFEWGEGDSGGQCYEPTSRSLVPLVLQIYDLEGN